MAMPRRGLWVLAMLAIVLIAGCREEEQDRVLLYDKGTYQGTKDTALPPGQEDALRQRAREAYEQ